MANNDGTVPITVSTINPKLDDDQVTNDARPEVGEENSPEAEGGDEPLDIDESLKATHNLKIGDDEMLTAPVDQVADEIVDNSTENIVEEENRVG